MGVAQEPAIDEAEIAEARTVCNSVAKAGSATTEIEFAVGPAGGQLMPMPTALAGLMPRSLAGLVAAPRSPSSQVGSHTRLSAADVLAFRRDRHDEQRRAFDELRKLDEEIGIEP